MLLFSTGAASAGSLQYSALRLQCHQIALEDESYHTAQLWGGRYLNCCTLVVVVSVGLPGAVCAVKPSRRYQEAVEGHAEGLWCARPSDLLLQRQELLRPATLCFRRCRIHSGDGISDEGMPLRLCNLQSSRQWAPSHPLTSPIRCLSLQSKHAASLFSCRRFIRWIVTGREA